MRPPHPLFCVAAALAALLALAGCKSSPDSTEGPATGSTESGAAKGDDEAGDDKTGDDKATPAGDLTLAKVPSPGKGKCQKDVGCGEAGVIPTCANGIEPIPYGEAIDSRTPIIGKEVTVKGTLSGNLACTEMGCPPEDPCCNGCGGQLALTGAEATLTLVDTKDPERYTIAGDETMACPPLPTGGEVVARGVISTPRGGYVIQDPVLCLP